MPTAGTKSLSITDLDSLRTAVAAGRKPKVVFTSAAGQIAGQTGQIVRFDDPIADEWVVVRFGRDELPFAPGDLQLPPPKPPRPKSDISTATTPLTNGSTPVTADAPISSTPPTGSSPTSSPATGAEMNAASSVDAPPAAGTSTAGSNAAGAGAGAGAGKGRPARRPSGKGRSPELTVVLGHHEGQWTVQASRGPRVVVKPTPVRAADALKMVHLLDSPAVAEAVDEIVAAARAGAEEQATRLRRELAEVEASLADLSDDE